MTQELQNIISIPVESITILNPRERNKRVFEELTTSIANLGLKKPITVTKQKDGEGYDLVCGQGRLEAFIALGQSEIPAIVIDVAQDDCFVMSLVENMARRQPSSLELIREIEALKKRGYSPSQIAIKTDFSPEYIHSICFLLENGEERLVLAVERGVMPHSIAIEISRAKESGVQQALAEAYESGSLPGNQVVAIRRIIEQRSMIGRGFHTVAASSQSSARRVTVPALVQTYRRETERQKLMVKKATLTQSRLLFIVNALRKLFSDENFTTLLRAEAVNSLPKSLAERIDQMEK